VSGQRGAPAAARRGRAGAARPVRRGPWLGREFEVEIGPVAPGGHCVARHEGRVLFVRHTLPGERVVARVTEDRGGGFCRADAVRVLTAAPERVEPPCPHAGPGKCGGCDWQHASGAAQRALKAAVVREQLTRLAKLPDVPVTVEELPGGLLGSRTRVRYAVGPDGHTGLRRHRSHQLEPVAHCPLGTDAVTAAGAGERNWPDAAEVEVVATGTGDTTVLVRPRQDAPAADRRRTHRPDADADEAADPRVAGGGGGRVRSGPERVRERAGGREWELAAGGFWQVHPAAADTLAACVLDLLRPRPGETALDLYAGAGLFAGLLAAAVGPDGHVVAVEADERAAADARANAPGIEVRAARVTAGLLGGLGAAPDIAVLDPPRAGAGAEVLTALLALRPRAVAYVSCDPAALARDLRVAVDAGWRLAALRAFDCFPMTQHVETVALLEPESR
jgi:tRNA/tmRNA/rRNA uracil-C5-methylase (TrmA/RlmC/RlmD family)